MGVPVLCVHRNNRRGSTARAGCQRCGCNKLTRVIPQTGVTHFIRLIYIHNAAQGDEHDNLPSIESYPCGGEAKRAETKFVRERAVLNQRKCFDRDGATLVGLFAPLLEYDMDALKSAGRAIIRSPSIAKQSWGAGRHKSEYSPLKSLTFTALAGASLR